MATGPKYTGKKITFPQGTPIYAKDYQLGGSDKFEKTEDKLEEEYIHEMTDWDEKSDYIAINHEGGVNAQYLAVSDAEENAKTAKKILGKIVDFLYEEEPAKKHLKEDENGNMIEVEGEPKRSINWFKVGACSTSVTLMLIGAIIMLIKKHH